MSHFVAQSAITAFELFERNQLLKTTLSQNAENVLSLCLLSYCRQRDYAFAYRFLP